MDGYRWIYTDKGGLLQIKQETKHCNGRNATPYMALVGNSWRRIYLFEDALAECYIKYNKSKIRVYLYD